MAITPHTGRATHTAAPAAHATTVPACRQRGRGTVLLINLLVRVPHLRHGLALVGVVAEELRAALAR